jgi:enoyl-CoA hydratase/carnithine racemase
MNHVIVSQHASVLELRLDRPAKKNALTFAMYDALSTAIESAAVDAVVRAVVITASGDAFCAGNDIGDFLNPTVATAGPPPSFRFMQAIASFPKPLLAAVGGVAVGIGATMLLHCDLVYAGPDARLSMPFVSLGLTPEAASTLLLPQRVGHAVASEMLLLGAQIDAARAKELGLVNDIVASPRDVALEKAAMIAERSPRAICVTKELLRRVDPSHVMPRLEEEVRYIAEALASAEGQQALLAFLERRAPSFA